MPSKQRTLVLVSSLGVVLLMLLVYWLITVHQTYTLRQQVLQVLPGASQLQHLHYNERTWQPAAMAGGNLESLYAGYDESGHFVGYAIPAEGPGYQSPIRLIYGYHPNQRLIVGITILDSGETSGWGDKVLKDRDFLANFQSLAVDPKLVIVDDGEKNQPNEVDIISGATISSQAIVQILNATNRRWLRHLPSVESAPTLVYP